MLKRIRGIPLAVTLVVAFIFLAIIVVIMWYLQADPLIDNGLSEYTAPDGNMKAYTIELVNNGSSDIDIQSVTVNGGNIPDLVQLGITYNSGHLVQYWGEQTDPATKIMDLHEASIHPKLSPEEIQNVFANLETSKTQTPIHYGVVVRYDKEPIQEVTIRYTYLRFTKEKRITKWFDSI